MFLRESLLALMKEKPIAKITPTELCRHANMNRNTFYTHYDSPEALLKSIEDEMYEQVRSSIERSLINESISALLTEICQAIYDHRDLCAVLFSEYGDKDFLRHIIDLAHDRTIYEWLAAGIQSEGEEAEMLYTYSVNGSVSLIQNWILGGMKKSPSELAQFIEKASYYGLQGFLRK
jgi:AcrR family transcriptional regulator